MNKLISKCPQYCDSCSSPTKCTKCKNNFYLSNLFTCINNCFADRSCACLNKAYACDQSGRKPVVCNSGKFVDHNGQSYPCPNNCLQLPPGVTCTICQGTYLHKDGSCDFKCPATFVKNDKNYSCDCRQNSEYSKIDKNCPCKDGYVDQGGVCQECILPNCSICASLIECSKCSQGYYLLNKSCLSECPPTFVANKIKKSCDCPPNSTIFENTCRCNPGFFEVEFDCKLCTNNCSVCASQTSCSKCEKKYYLHLDGSCVSKCPSTFAVDNLNKLCICRPNSTLSDNKCACNPGYFDENNICKQCESNCTSCSSQNVCTQCNLGFYQSMGACQACQQNCNECISQTICTSCKTNYYLHVDGTCVQDCPSTFKDDTQNQKCVCRENSTLQNNVCLCNIQHFDQDGICQPCISNCDECFSKSDCTACTLGYYLQIDQTCNSTCPPTFTYSQQQKCICRPNSILEYDQCSCKTGFFDINGNCDSCSQNCDQCTSQSACTLCSSNYYLFIDSTCVSSCPKTFLVDSSNTKCICRPNSFLQDNKCICNSGFLELNGECLQCPQNCEICASLTNCLTCSSSYYLNVDKSCVSQCPDTFIGDSVNRQCLCRQNSTLTNDKCTCNTGFFDFKGLCQPCTSNCDQCTSQDVCTLCSSNHFLFIDSTCVSSCPQTFLEDSSNRKCVCQPNSFLQNNKCICNSGFVEQNGECLQCPTNCEICPSQTSCLICSSPYYLNIDKNCVSQCRDTFIGDSVNRQCVCRQNSTLANDKCTCNKGFFDFNGVCQPCTSNCDLCTSQSVCILCSLNYFLFIDSTCVSLCPQTFLENFSQKKCVCRPNSFLQDNKCICNSGFVELNGECLQCPQNCEICPSLTNCLTCSSSYYLNVDKMCVSQCPDTFIGDSVNRQCICRQNSTLTIDKCTCNTGFFDFKGVCQPCTSNCDQCTSQAVCTLCSSNHFLFIDSTCVSSCTQTFLEDSSNRKCVCRPNSFLQNNKCICNSSFVELNGECLQCPPNCEICPSQSNCLICQSPYYLNIDKNCVSQCPDTFIGDSVNKQCVCRQNSTLTNDKCQCSTGFFDFNGVCQSCSQNCDQCTSQSVCTICSSNYFLFNDSTCVSLCPQTFLVDSSNQKCTCRANSTLQNNKCICNVGFVEINGQCESCSSNCYICSSQAVCLTCQPGYLLNFDATCITQCLPTFVIDFTQQKCVCRTNSSLQNNSCPCNVSYQDVSGVCQKCPQNCDQCSSQKVCQVCSSGFYLHIDNTCIFQCPNTFVKDSTNTKCLCRPNSTLKNTQCPCIQSGFIDVNDKCLNCPKYCDKCSSQTICTTCISGYYLTSNQTCSSRCPSSYILDPTNTKCICPINMESVSHAILIA
ncbi:zinc finger lsd1 subclass family protein (macronuclear) [Tetrahymena thermophila SB210]|uniref:Zinc finger lsd1 subclass family protein n=1 Tax=Tetrahymena thermophila (strain SB210) TaxID=312017 RepID=Q24DM3_TETTS|nr:zinc finger lsd1 subclass family protein [Tetrahymena thermophila SB210]EAS05890.2 zinc finger lsd1 subclass family protein [Tetrahymena thermophila SB210]|eukprot:XP_001026135.2 zinc finger lsd1 subclass family protein [Tetrahymena thermophila SB210]